MIRGEPVIVRSPQRAYDENKDPVTAWADEAVEGVLFGAPTTEQADETMRLYGVRAAFVAHFPKAYTGSLRGCKLYRPRDGRTYDVVGDPQPYPPENCPPHVPWNREAVVGWVDG